MVDETNETPQEDRAETDALSGEPEVTVENQQPPETLPPGNAPTAAGEEEPEQAPASPPASAEPSPVGESAAEEAEDTSEAAHGLTLGEGAPAEGDEEAAPPRPAPMIRGKVDRFGVAMGTGRRKTSVARVRISDGSGSITVNGRAIDDYVALERDRLLITAPLRAVEMEGKVDIAVTVRGGGPTGQAGAIVLGIARALQAKSPQLHVALSDGGYLTRDPRMVERKKYGHKKARRSFQFSKR